jgi:hypothetical protein
VLLKTMGITLEEKTCVERAEKEREKRNKDEDRKK